jgi:hypothetical protein
LQISAALMRSRPAPREKPDLCGLSIRILPAPFLFNFLGYSHTLEADIIDWFKGAGQRLSDASG